MMAPPKQKHESLSEEPDSDGGGASDFILKAISPSKRRPSSIPGVSGAKTKKKKKKKMVVAAAATEADKHIAISADAGNVGVTKMKKIKSDVVQVVQKGVNKDGDETLKEKILGGEMIPPSGGGGRGGGGAVALEEDDAGQSSSRKRNKKMSNRSNKENNKKEKVKQKKIKEKRKDEEKISGDEMMIPPPPNGVQKKKEGEDNTGNRKESKKSKRAEPARETEVKEKQECRSEEEIRGDLSSAEDTNNAVNMTVEVGKEKEQEDQEGKELNCEMEDFWCHHPNLKESMETGMFGPMPLAGKWLSSNTLGREKAKELEQKWMSLRKAETELFHERMVLIKEEIGGVLSTVADP